MESKKLKNKLIKNITFIIAVFMLLLSFSPLKIFAYESNASIVPTIYETETQYRVVAYVEMQGATPMSMGVVNENGYLVFNVNGVDFVEEGIEGEIILEKGSTTYNVIIKYVPNIADEFEIITCGTQMTLSAVNASGEETGDLSTVAKVLQTLLPLLLLATVIVVVLILVLKKKLTPTQVIAKNLNAITKAYVKIKNDINNPNRTEKIKDNRYRNYLKNSKHYIGKSITTLIPLNIESMGLYNSLLANFLQVEKIIEAETQIQGNTTLEERLTYLNKFQYSILPKLYTNLNEIKKVLKRIKENNSTLFVQHSRANKIFKNEEESKKFLDKTIYNNSTQINPLIKSVNKKTKK